MESTFDDIDEIVNCAVVVNQDICVVDFVFGKDILHNFLVQMGQSFSAVQFDSSQLGGSDTDLGRVFIEPNAHLFQLPADFNFVLFGLSSFQDHQNHIRILRHSNNLLSSTLAVSSPFDNTGQIQQLNLGVVVVDHTRDAGQCGELVGSSEGGCVSDAGEQGGLTDGGEADHAHSGVTEATHFEALALASLGGGFQQLGSVLCQLRLQLTHVVLRSLVLLGPRDLLLDLPDLLRHSHLG